VVDRALADSDRGLGPAGKYTVTDDAREFLLTTAQGDARTALNTLELAARLAGRERRIERGTVEEALQKRALIYDKQGEEHFNVISALHKSLRGSDPDAALYWLARMLEAGEDPLYVARRLVRFASEDVGLADAAALGVAVAARDAVHFIGMPEGELALAEATVYLAAAPNSNALYRAYGRAKEDAQATSGEPVPMHIRNAPTPLMSELGYGAGYVYDHDAEDAFSGQEFLPESLQGKRYYEPTARGTEGEIAERLARWRELRGDRANVKRRRAR
jgi:putative ATPase